MSWLLIAFFAVCARAQDPLLWGRLAPGPHAVGYRTSFVLDESRTYDGKTGRPILLQVWYPAMDPGRPKLTYQEYFEIPPLTQYPRLGDRLRSLARDAICTDLFKRPSESLLQPMQRAAFKRLLGTRTAAALNARDAPGRFPVVLYHAGAGGSFEENSLLFEYLATYGYIVVSSAFQSPFTDSVRKNVGGIERSGPDLAFIAKQAGTWPSADPDKVAAIGHSAGAQHVLEWMGNPNCVASAVVSLDSTLEYDEFLHFHKSLLAAFDKLTPPRVPVILFARSVPKPRFSAFRQYLRSAPHYEAEVADVDHDDFLTHGFLGLALTGSRRSERVRQAYEEVCRTIKAFLDSAVGTNSGGGGFPPNRAAGSPVSIRYRPPLAKAAP